jgi:hypothetical protein
MILETALASKTSDVLLTRETKKALSALKHVTKRFIFDDSASFTHGKFSIECADLVCQNAQFAVAPYPNTYIEIDNIHSMSASQSVYPDAARRVGYWFTETGDIYCVSGDENEAYFVPFVYHHINTGRNNDFPKDYDKFKTPLMLGQISEDLRDKVDHFSHLMTEVWDVSLTQQVPRNIFEAMFKECAGSLKRGLAAVLLLNQRKAVTVKEVAPTRHIVGGKMRTYAAHSVVTIDISSDPIELRRSFRETDIHMRRHEVRGHYVHYDVMSACDHNWQVLRNETLSRRDMDRVGRDIARWYCGHCGGRRVFKEAHYRGDAALGYVTKDYEVTDKRS